MSFAIVKDIDGKRFYWQYGIAGGWTENVKDARLYAMKISANQAMHRLSKRFDMTGAKTELVKGR